MYNSIRGTLKYVEKSVTESFQSIKNQTHSVFSQMMSTHSVTGSSHTSSRVIREEMEGPISEQPEFPVSLAKTQKEYTVKTGPGAGSLEGTLTEHEQKLMDFIGQFDESARILAECRSISSLKKAAPQSTRELEKMFLKDYSFLDDRFSSILTNHINNLSRDLNQYQRAAVHKVEWLQLNQMIRNFLLLHQSLYPSNTIIDANMSKTILKHVTGTVDADITALAEDIKKAMINWPHAQFLRLKMNLRHLERLCRCMDDFSDTLFRPMSILFAPLLMKNGPPQLSFQIKGIEPSASPLPQTKITSPSILMSQESITLPKPSPPACVSPNILSSAKEAEEDEDAEEDALLELEFDRWNRAKAQGRRMTKFADVIAKMVDSKKKEPAKPAPRAALRWRDLRVKIRDMGPQKMERVIERSVRRAAEQTVRKGLAGLAFSEQITQEALGAKMFVEQGCQTAAASGLEMILRHLDAIFKV
ncbi:hypothetical protein BJ741DRAFT_601920 [Chytriomyces cf. hyalinus JEL632]|nr:hypothetical protein BJ741DRAFT_601920 [Chytriomyces cf. hyalinus JEL632]